MKQCLLPRPRLVLADDNPQFMTAVALLLNRSFEIVGTATDGAAALKVVLEMDPDVLVVDLSMPLMTGLEVARQLQRVHHRARIVLLTVLEDRDLMRACGAAGIQGYVIKRRAATDLVRAVEAATTGQRFASPASEAGNDEHEAG